jgi:hypothetical protein
VVSRIRRLIAVALATAALGVAVAAPVVASAAEPQATVAYRPTYCC